MAKPGAIDDAFLDLAREMDARLRRLASAYCGVEEHDDLLQEMRLQIWKAWSSFDGRAKRTTWAYRVALNTALMHRRTTGRRIATASSDVERIGGQTHAQQAAMLREFLSKLGPVDRAVFVLFLEDMTRDEMVDVLGLSTSAIASRLNRVKNAFRADYMEVDE